MTKTTNKIWIILGSILCVISLLASCTEDSLWSNDANDATDGYIRVEFTTNIDNIQQVNTRSADPDGIDIQNLTLFCFNSYGLFITTVDASINKNSATDGTFKTEIPKETHIIHFIANQNSNLYNNKDFLNKNEEAVIADMEGASGMLIYWARFERNGTQSINDQWCRTHTQPGDG